MALSDGYIRDPMALSAQLMAQTACFYARSVRAGMEIAKTANPMLAAMLQYMDDHPNGWRIDGIRKLAAQSPFRDAASRFPDSIGFQVGLGPAALSESNAPKSAKARPDLVALRRQAADCAGILKRFISRETDTLPRDFRAAAFKASASDPARNIEGAAFLTELQFREHKKADFHDLLCPDVTVLGETHALKIENIEELDRPHAGMLRFSTDYSDAQPADSNNVVYLKAPMSGHYSTLIYNVIQNYVAAGFTVYVEDKKDARNVPVWEEDHGFDGQVDYDRDALAYIYEREGTPAQLTSICQASVPATITSAVLAQEQAPYRPSKLCVISAPIDVSINPSLVNKYAQIMPDFLTAVKELEFVPVWEPGFMRRVRSGAQQVSSFESGNTGRFASYYASIFNYITANDPDWDKNSALLQKEIGTALRRPGISAEEKDFLGLMEFIVEYKTYMDMDGRAFLDSWFQNFKANALAENTAKYHGRRVDLNRIDCPVLTVDAIDDDISSIGQSMALLRKNLSGDKRALVVPDKGHFWWSGGTAKAVQWPMIFAWHKADLQPGDAPALAHTVLDADGNVQDDPVLPQPCDDPEPLIALARDVHRKNLGLEQQKIASGEDLSFTMIVNGSEYKVPLAPWSLQPGHV